MARRFAELEVISMDRTDLDRLVKKLDRDFKKNKIEDVKVVHK